MNPSEQQELRNFVISKHKYTFRNGCWLTSENKDWSIYSVSRYKGRSYPTHRLTAQAWLGLPLDSWLHVCHKCDIKACFNPKHLFIGTDYDNRKDSLDKKRRDQHQYAPNFDSLPFGQFKKDFEEHLNKWFNVIGL